ncbi:hypothetical protein LL912_11985 [Niabella sp. CC-SYL272]|uniref:glycine-rich domain-containing protein n=1 Tax=Niabella agricola TaxID=2891571 RepID=UPI001F40E561|nr:hypothetical protein [Niabella agricola]MCF3109492.1 hypothetical protein [Niabella agricola]
MKLSFFSRMRIRCALVSMLLLLLFSTVSAQTTTYYYTNTAQSFIVPAGQANKVTIKVWGAGGGGGTRASGNSTAGGGGGGGAYSQVNVTLQPGTYTVNVGGGGVSGTNGSASSFNISPAFIITANGGSSGSNNSTAGSGGVAQTAGETSFWSVNGATGIINFGGGNGADGNSSVGGYGGGGGGAAGSGGSGANSLGRGPGNGNDLGGNGGEGANTNLDATAGDAPGGGGGGGFRTNGGNNRPALSGGNGRVEVTVLLVLPVQFESVTAIATDDDLLVNFTTLEENNNDHFNIQASGNGTDFQTIATIKSKHAGAVFTGATTYSVRTDKNGNMVLLGLSVLAAAALGFGGARRNRKIFMSAVLCYVLIGMAAVSCRRNSAEIAPVEGSQKAFIRIEQVDADGHSSYSKVVAVVKK